MHLGPSFKWNPKLMSNDNIYIPNSAFSGNDSTAFDFKLIHCSTDTIDWRATNIVHCCIITDSYRLVSDKSANQRGNLFTRSCSSCGCSRPDLPFNRLPGSEEQVSGSTTSPSLSREDQVQAGQRAAHSGGASLDAPRVTLFKSPSRELDSAPAQTRAADKTTELATDLQDSRQQLVGNEPLGLLRDLNRQLVTTNGPAAPTAEAEDSRETRESERGPAGEQANDGAAGAAKLALSESSKRLLVSSEDYGRILWRAARDYQQTDHYDYSLFGLNVHLDKAVARHQREAMLYNQGESIARAPTAWRRV